MKIKVCGMAGQENTREAEIAGVDMIGFIFYHGSSRFVGDIEPVLTSHVNRVGVFVNEEPGRILELADLWDLDIIQLHGDETPEDCAFFTNTRLKVVKALSVGEEFDFKRLDGYANSVDYFLFDTKGKNYGGNGMVFDWDILKKYDYDVPFWLSGGIHPGLSGEISKLTLPMLYAVDVNSGFEVSPGIKNIQKLKLFVDELQD